MREPQKVVLNCLILHGSLVEPVNQKHPPTGDHALPEHAIPDHILWHASDGQFMQSNECARCSPVPFRLRSVGEGEVHINPIPRVDKRHGLSWVKKHSLQLTSSDNDGH